MVLPGPMNQGGHRSGSETDQVGLINGVDERRENAF
jgi:hypothetical protein